MPDGAAVRLPLSPSIENKSPVAGAPGHLSKDDLPAGSKPNAAPTKAEIEDLIGQVTAAAAATLCEALAQFQDGGLAPATRTMGGDLIAGMYELQQSTLGKLDFVATVRREGKVALRRQHGAAFRQCHGRDLDEAALDEIIGHLLAVVAKVTAVERAIAH